jgi:hypothetical protein
MARKPKQRNGAAPEPPGILGAIKFISAAAKEIGAPFETHCVLGNHWAIATNGVVSIGHAIVEEIIAYPHTHRLIDALARCTAGYTVTQLDAGRLAVTAGKFRAIVPCIEPALAQLPFPDPPVAAIDDRLRVALETAGVLAAESAQHVLTASVLLQGGSAIGTNRHVIFECWHGIDLPPGLVIPKSAIVALSKTSKPLAQFGFSPTSVTFYFDDQSWLKTQLYSEPWPAKAGDILNITVNTWPFPANFWEAIAAVEPFAEEGKLHFTASSVRTHSSADVGAAFELTGVPDGVILSADYLDLIKPYAKSVDFKVQSGREDKGGYMLVFYGDNIRGAIAGMRA